VEVGQEAADRPDLARGSQAPPGEPPGGTTLGIVPGRLERADDRRADGDDTPPPPPGAVDRLGGRARDLVRLGKDRRGAGDVVPVLEARGAGVQGDARDLEPPRAEQVQDALGERTAGPGAVPAGSRRQA
jgi:hypothetical protein